MASDLEFSDQIIIKRRANTEMETPKGGVWKIAFADFMTAMMCFFLVMWLINAANEDTRKAVASYFNPVRLAELNRKGVQKPHNQPDNPSTKGEQTTEESTPGDDPTGEPTANIPREALFKDPYKVLSQIAGEAPPTADAVGLGAASGRMAATDVSAAGAGPFRDPFDPEFSKGTPSGGAGGSTPAAAPVPPPTAALADGGADQAGPLRLSLPESEPPPLQVGARLPISPVPDTSAQLAVAPLPQSGEGERSGESARAELQAELSDAIQKESGSHHSPSVAVEQTGEGVMISLTDDIDFGMFSIGSAQPQPQLVRIMQRIAMILKSRNGSITIRGHTDARPFRSGNYDNWRLSTDRAQMAYYMLVRGGLDEKRVAAIEGYADRKLKVPGDPEAAENRRIEILLQEDTL